MTFKVKNKKVKEKKSSYSILQAKLKKKEWDNPNKMKFESSFKEFNKQTNLIITGNAYTNTQTSAFIRPYSEDINPVGEKVSRGHLRNWDLNNFESLPYNVRKDIEKKTQNKSVILYEFKHYKEGKKIVDGYVLTDDNYKHIKTYHTNPNDKSQSAVNEAKKYISLGEK